MKVLAVGDIHTKLWIIDSVEKLIDNYDAIVFVGDYADDWNASALQTIETWKQLRLLQSIYGDKIKIVMGNHDYIYVNKTPSSQSGYSYVTQTLINAPENKKLKAWLSALPIIEYLDGIMYSHAGVLDAWAERYNGKLTVDTLWIDQSPLWIRPHEGYEYRSYQVFGHTPSQTCWEVQPNVWCIDTFSTYPDDSPYGDNTALEITDGQQFKKVKIKNDNHNSTSSLKTRLPRKGTNSNRTVGL